MFCTRAGQCCGRVQEGVDAFRYSVEDGSGEQVQTVVSDES